MCSLATSHAAAATTVTGVLPIMPSPYSYIREIFRANSVKKGGIVLRKVADVHKLASFKALLDEVEIRRFHLIETGDQYVIICNPGNFKLHR